MQGLVLRANSVSCLLFGGLFVFVPVQVAAFLGNPPKFGVIALGIILIMNGLHLLRVSMRKVSSAELCYFALGDLAWVIGTALLLGAGLWITTLQGVIAAVLIALMVGTFGILQWRMAMQSRNPQLRCSPPVE